jgi:type II secretory pathway pseudopilin PulG
MRPTQHGFGYLLVLFAVAAMGLALAGVGQVWHTTVQREKEAELLAIGEQFRQALASYYAGTPGSEKQYPQHLEDLLLDRRSGKPLRHLRRLYADPMNGGPNWGLVQQQGRIVGVYSLSKRHAFKTAFAGRDLGFNGSLSYDQWIFTPAPAPDATNTLPASPDLPS